MKHGSSGNIGKLLLELPAIQPQQKIYFISNPLIENVITLTLTFSDVRILVQDVRGCSRRHFEPAAGEVRSGSGHGKSKCGHLLGKCQSYGPQTQAGGAGKTSWV